MSHRKKDNKTTKEMNMEDKNHNSSENNENGSLDTFMQDEDNFSIYEYIKNHPSFLIAIFTAIISMVTFFSRVASYALIKNRLFYWGIDTAYASIDNSHLFYKCMADILFFLSQLVLMYCFFANINIYINNNKFCTATKLLYKEYKKRLKDYDKMANSLNMVANNLNMDNIDKSTEQGIRTTLDSLKELYNIIRKQEYKDLFYVVSYTIPIIIFIVIITMMKLLMDNAPGNIFVNTMILTIVQILFYAICLIIRCAASWRSIKKELLKPGTDILSKQTSKEIRCYVGLYKKYPLKSCFTDTKIEKISDKTFKLIIASFLSFSIMFIVVLSVGDAISYKLPSKYQLYFEDDQVYAVVYRDNNLYYMEKAIIIDNKIVIDTKEQRIANKDDISLSLYEFDKVIKK